MEDDLRGKLDTASLLPRGKWKDLWKAAADEFGTPAVGSVTRAFEDESPRGGDAAIAWLANPETDLPSASLRAWIAALSSLRADTDEQRKELRQRANTMVKTMRATTDLERVMPLFVAPFGPGQWRVRNPILRAKWLDSIPCGPAAAVVLVMRDPTSSFDDFSSNAFHALSKIRTLPSEARGALWMRVWAEPDGARWHWHSLAALGEPAAIAAILHDTYLWSDGLPMRPALTRALCRIITREDPWLEGKHDASDPGAPKPDIIVARALDHLARVADATGTTELAVETLDTRWTSLGRAGALTRARLGCADAVGALIPALSPNTAPAVASEDSLADFENQRRHSPEAALLALACVGQNARAALDAVRNAPESFERTLALAAIDPQPQALDALIPIVEHAVSGAAEIRSQYEEGLITNDEYARKVIDEAEFAQRLWKAHGETDARREVIARLRALLVAEHQAIHDDFVVRRFVD